MPIENMEEQGLEKNPKLELAQYKFLLTMKENQNNIELKTKLLEEIKADNMAPWYEIVCADLGWPVDQQLLAQMKETNTKKIEELDAVIEDAEKNLGEMEVREVSDIQLQKKYLK
jgi:26S proteasome regulatory subunit N7